MGGRTLLYSLFLFFRAYCIPVVSFFIIISSKFTVFCLLDASVENIWIKLYSTVDIN